MTLADAEAGRTWVGTETEIEARAGVEVRVESKAEVKAMRDR